MWGLCGWDLCEWSLCLELVWGGVYVGGAYVGGVCVGGVKKGRSQKIQFILSFAIPVNKMNLKYLPLLNHIPYKSKELYLLYRQFKKAHLSSALDNLFQNEISTYIFLQYHEL